MEKNNTRRLSKVSKRLNVPIKTITEHLKSLGIKIENNPMAKLNDDIYQLVKLKFEIKLDNTFLKDPSVEIIEEIKKNYSNIFKLTPHKFELLIGKILENWGYEVSFCGKTNEKDGGVDLIAKKIDLVTTYIAVQIKFKENIQNKVTSKEVRDFVGSMDIINRFNAGMLVTNTDFTSDSKWIENIKQPRLKLKNSHDIQQWLLKKVIPESKMQFNLTNKKDLNF